MIKTGTSKGGLHLYTLSTKDVDMHPELRRKYSKLKQLRFGIHPDNDLQGEFTDHNNTISTYQFKSLHPDEIKSKKIEDIHKNFMEELNNNFGVAHHEFIHAHQAYVQGKPGKIPFMHRMFDRKPTPEQYVNYPHEVESFTRHMAYHLDKAMRTHPHKFIFSTAAKGVFPGFKDERETHHNAILRDLDRHMYDHHKKRTEFSTIFSLSSPENRGQYSKHIDEIMNRYRSKIFSSSGPIS